MRKLCMAMAYLYLSLISACSDGDGSARAVVEVVQARDWKEVIKVEGEIKSAESTNLSVPGSGWDKRRLLEMVPDGSVVEKGQLIARFDAPVARLNLSQAETDLLRKVIAENSVKEYAQIGHIQLSADTEKVEGDLRLSQRYANTDLQIFEKNKILDILVDIGFLNSKQQYLSWKNKQIGARTGAEQALISSQRDSVQNNIDIHKKSLAELELRAPHAGVFLLVRKWNGTVAQVGGNVWAGEEFGSLPDLEKQIASFSIPEGQSFGLHEGQDVTVRLAGTGNELHLKVSKVGKNSSTKSKDSPVKYSDFEANIDHESVRRLDLKPGQAIAGEVSLLEKKSVLTVPNISLIQEGQQFFVMVQNGSTSDKQKVEIGMRGQSRSEIKSGIKAGTSIVIVPTKKEDKA